jgi:hypothetical protein
VRWVDALNALLADLAADATLSAIAGFEILRHGEFVEPPLSGIAWTVFSDISRENTQEVRVQLDVFARGLDEALTVEGRLRARHGDTPQTIQGLRMLVQLEDARDHNDPEPGRVHRSLDFHLEPTR